MNLSEFFCCQRTKVWDGGNFTLILSIKRNSSVGGGLKIAYFCGRGQRIFYRFEIFLDKIQYFIDLKYFRWNSIFLWEGGEQEGKKRLIAARADVGLLTCTSRAFDFMKHQYLKYFFKTFWGFEYLGYWTCSPVLLIWNIKIIYIILYYTFFPHLIIYLVSDFLFWICIETSKYFRKGSGIWHLVFFFCYFKDALLSFYFYLGRFSVIFWGGVVVILDRVLVSDI